MMINWPWMVQFLWQGMKKKEIIGKMFWFFFASVLKGIDLYVNKERSNCSVTWQSVEYQTQFGCGVFTLAGQN
jgi:hypothetical protein